MSEMKQQVWPVRQHSAARVYLATLLSYTTPSSTVVTQVQMMCAGSQRGQQSNTSLHASLPAHMMYEQASQDPQLPKHGPAASLTGVNGSKQNTYLPTFAKESRLPRIASNYKQNCLFESES